MKPIPRLSTPPIRPCAAWTSNNSDSSQAIFWRPWPPAENSARRTSSAGPPAGFDAVIANPPYVRTQVLGAHRAGLLAAQFGLTGRVDLYQAFARAMAGVLKPGGVLGLLTSNRFLTVKSGRRCAHASHAVRAPGYLRPGRYQAVRGRRVARHRGGRKESSLGTRPLPFRSDLSRSLAGSDRGPGHRSGLGHDERSAPPIPSCRRCSRRSADGRTSGLVRTPTGVFRVERGFLSNRPAEAIWTLSNADSEAWLKVVERHVGPKFDDVGRIRVGIKTTADQVFIRDDWNSLPLDRRPEGELLRPLLRHFGAARWLAGAQRQAVLYPHTVSEGRRRAIDLAVFPRASRYLEEPSSAAVAQAIRRR